MYFNWIETRNKITGITWKKAEFDRYNLLSSDDSALPQALLQLIHGMQHFALNQQPEQYANTISRTSFRAAHEEFLWFAKSTANDQGFAIDEEELYDQQNNMLMRRGFGEMTIGDGPIQPLDQTQSMLYVQRELTAPAKILQAFSHIHYLQPTDATLGDALSQILQSAHGQVFLLDGSKLSVPVDLTAVLAQKPASQLFATNCSNPPTIVINAKGKMLTCQRQH